MWFGLENKMTICHGAYVIFLCIYIHKTQLSIYDGSVGVLCLCTGSITESLDGLTEHKFIKLELPRSMEEISLVTACNAQ